MILAANAVLKAVNSPASMNPTGTPERSKIVRVPRGLVLETLATEAGGENDDPLTDDVPVEVWLSESDDTDVWLNEVAREDPSLVEAEFVVAGSSRATIFRPRLVEVLDGMKRAVVPSLFITVRNG